MSMDGLMVPRHAPWLADFKHELMTFPAGKHDDQVDALSLFGQLLELVSEGNEEKDEKPKPKELEYIATPGGVIQGNLSVKDAIDAMIKRKRGES